MTREEKNNYLRVALNLQNVSINTEMADRVIETYEAILEKEGEFSLDDAVGIELTMNEKYTKKKLEDK